VEEMAKMITQMRGLGMDDLFQGSDCTTNPYKMLTFSKNVTKNEEGFY